MITFKVTSIPFDEVETHLAVVPLYEDIRPLKGTSGWVDWRLCGKISNLILSHRFSGARGELLLMPSQGRLASQEILCIGLGHKEEMSEKVAQDFLHFMVEKIMLKKARSFCFSLSDLIPEMFDWRNQVRAFASMISGRKEELAVALVEPASYIADAKKRQMDFGYDIKVHYELLE